jgi:hypothetical protein
MTSQKHNITVTRGESFSIDKAICNQDGSPFVVSNKLKNAHFLLTIAQSKYSQNGRQVIYIWLPIEHTFYCTNAIKVSSFNSKPDIDVDDIDLSTYAIYYVEENGVKIYKRWTGSSYEDYELRFVYTFSSHLTSNLVAQDYVYTIDLVDGESTEQLIDELYESQVGGSSITSYDKYVELKELGLSEDIDLNKAIHNIAFSLPILTAKTLTVNNNINGGYYE